MNDQTRSAQTERLVQGMLEHFVPGQWETVFPGFLSMTADGLGYLYQDPTSLRIGFIARAELSVTPELLARIATWNKLQVMTSAWLSPGADEANWLLVMGTKTPYAHLNDETIKQVLLDPLGHFARLRDLADEQFAEFGGSRIPIDRSKLGGYGLVLMGHLG